MYEHGKKVGPRLEKGVTRVFVQFGGTWVWITELTPQLGAAGFCSFLFYCWLCVSEWKY